MYYEVDSFLSVEFLTSINIENVAIALNLMRESIISNILFIRNSS